MVRYGEIDRILIDYAMYFHGAHIMMIHKGTVISPTFRQHNIFLCGRPNIKKTLYMCVNILDINLF